MNAQASLFLDRPAPDQLFRQGSQNDRLYRRLLQGPVTNSEIVEQMRIYNSTGRASDIRKKLRPHLLDIKAEPVPGTTGQWLYRLR